LNFCISFRISQFLNFFIFALHTLTHGYAATHAHTRRRPADRDGRREASGQQAASATEGERGRTKTNAAWQILYCAAADAVAVVVALFINLFALANYFRTRYRIFIWIPPRRAPSSQNIYFLLLFASVARASFFLDIFIRHSHTLARRATRPNGLRARKFLNANRCERIRDAMETRSTAGRFRTRKYAEFELTFSLPPTALLARSTLNFIGWRAVRHCDPISASCSGSPPENISFLLFIYFDIWKQSFYAFLYNSYVYCASILINTRVCMYLAVFWALKD